MGYLLSVAECRLYQPVSGCKICPILKKNWFCLTHLCRPVSLKWRFYFQWSLSTLYLLACQVGVTVGDTGLCFCVPCYTCDVSRALCKRVEAIQISCHLHPPLRLWNMDPACWLWRKDPGFRNQVPEEASPHLLLGAQDQRLGAEQDQLPCGSIGTSSGNFQETDTCLVQACHTQQQHLQNHPSGSLGGWTTPWKAEEMLDGQHWRMDIPAHARTGLLQKGLKEDLCWIVSHVPPTTQSAKGLNWAELSSAVSSLCCLISTN